jgi:hypothetical protein
VDYCTSEQISAGSSDVLAFMMASICCSMKSTYRYNRWIIPFSSWPDGLPVNERILTMGELFHFQAAICWPLAVMTASVC